VHRYASKKREMSATYEHNKRMYDALEREQLNTVKRNMLWRNNLRQQNVVSRIQSLSERGRSFRDWTNSRACLMSSSCVDVRPQATRFQLSMSLPYEKTRNKPSKSKEKRHLYEIKVSPACSNKNN
jgi:hypothetical protein